MQFCNSSTIRDVFGLDNILPEDFTTTFDEMMKSMRNNTYLFEWKVLRQDIAISTVFILGNHLKYSRGPNKGIKLL